MRKVIPSIASACPTRLDAELARIPGAACLHFDFEDGNFLPNITFGLKTAAALCEGCEKEKDAHLLVTDPMRYVQPLARMGMAAMAAHMEALPYPAQFLSAVQGFGARAGLAFNIKTEPEQVLCFVPQLDYVLLMTAEPDGRGDCFNESVLPKIEKMRALLPREKELWVDGGIGEVELPWVVAAGADTVIMGRAVWAAEDPNVRVQALQAMANKR